ncbi:MAG: S53 family peptidase [Rhodocyclaceae bacterium]|nr:S53 family peptidase [Rhodocyclaceae bacterium]
MTSSLKQKLTLKHGIVAFALTVLSFAPAAHAQQVERSGAVFHVKACGGPAVLDSARCHAHIVTDSAGTPRQNLDRHGRGFTPPADTGTGTNATANVTPAGYSPADLRSAYGLSSTDGWMSTSGSTTIAIVDAYGYTNALKDLNVYRNQFGLGTLPTCSSTVTKTCFAKYNQKGQQTAYPQQNTGWAQETALDLQMASAMCPSCKIILVEANSASYSDLATAVNTAAKLGAHVISNSYGGGEAGTTSYNSAYTHPGIAITVSSGDAGYGVEYPASSPNVTAVGGTSLYRETDLTTYPRGWYEAVWSGAGSGCSTVYGQPSWQAGLGTACRMRTVADVSAVADPATGVAVYAPISSTSSAWVVFGGTSVAAPLIAGMFAINNTTPSLNAQSLYQECGAQGQACTYLNDVTSGSNGSCGGTYLCTAGAYYDGPSGLGTPRTAGAFR